jgi:excinuclease UvrABC nuclease subunit
MLVAANNLEFEKAALMRDQIRELKRSLEGGAPAAKSELVSYGREKLASRGRGRGKSRAR